MRFLGGFWDEGSESELMVEALSAFATVDLVEAFEEVLDIMVSSLRDLGLVPVDVVDEVRIDEFGDEMGLAFVIGALYESLKGFGELCYPVSVALLVDENSKGENLRLGEGTEAYVVHGEDGHVVERG
jgi:hypothetical protein